MIKHARSYKGPRPVITCWRCHEDKSRAEFPIGKSGKRISPVCMTCIEIEAYESKDKRERRCATKVAKNGRVIRRCAKCKRWKDLKRDYYKSAKAKRDSKYPKPVLCKVCSNANKRAWEKRNADRHRATHREAAKRYRTRHVARRKAAAKRRWAAIKADPLMHAQVLEDGRINRRIRKARRGQKTRVQRARVSQPTGRSYLPSRPLVKLIGARIDHQERLDKLRGTYAKGESIKAICESLGISDRTYRHWLAGEQPSVRVGTAERVIANAGLDWQDVYPQQYADVFLAHAEMAA